MEALFARAEQEVTGGRVPACQLALACGDEVLTATFGAPDHARFVLFSLTKSFLAGAMWVLFGEELLSPATRVAELIPEFGSHGKDMVTVEHLMTHTAGFPQAPMSPEKAATSAGRVEQFAQWRLEWEPGTRAGYHPISAHWVLAELIVRVAGIDYRKFVRDRVLSPLGLSTLALGVPEADQADIVPVAADDVAGAVLLRRFNEPAVLALGVPGAGGVGSAADMARYFQQMLRNSAGLWDDAVLRDATSRVRHALIDPFTNIPANRSLGLMIAGDDGNAWMREFGQSVGPRAFIASGAGGQVAWADPDSGLSFCFVTSGIDSDVVRGFLHSSELSTMAGNCVVR